MRRILKAVCCLAIAAMIFGGAPAPAHAEDGTYEKTNSYVLYYGRNVADKKIIEYASPFSTYLSYIYADSSPYMELVAALSLYSTYNSNVCLPVYCVDQYTGVREGSYYKRSNLEDSSFFSDETAAKLRSIVLKGFPHTSVADMAAAAGVEGLTQGEAVHATQLAIWQTAYGSTFGIETMAEVSSYWRDRSYSSLIRDKDGYIAELNTLLGASEEDIDKAYARIQAAYNYLMSLEGTAPSQRVVTASSFKDWSSEPSLTKNADGTYDVTISATVDVSLAASDSLTLTATLGDRHVSTSLANGTQVKTLTFKNVPASDADEAITLNIDGTQTAAGVYMFVPDGDREATQQLISYCNLQQPVHAEVKVEPERILNFTKTTYGGVPLEGITFDIYLVAERDEYLSGEANVPKDPSNYPYSGYGDYTVVTDSNGMASFNLSKSHMPDGVYLVVERQHPAIEAPVAPFYVILPATSQDGKDLEYVVNVKPKNTPYNDVDIQKDVLELGNDEASVDVGMAHPWIVSASIPRDIAQGKSYVVSDTLDNRLDFLGNVKVQVETADGASVVAKLVDGADYKLVVADVDSLAEGKPSDSFSVQLTSSGMAKVAAAANGDFANHELRVVFDAQVNANAQVGEQIPNQATLNYKNSVGVLLGAESDVPAVCAGGLQVLKVDAADHSVVLEGAQFQLYRPASEAEMADESIEKTYLVGIETGMVPVEFFDNPQLEGQKVSTVTSSAEGKCFMYGLAFGDYYLVETNAPAGYNLLGNPVKLTLDAQSHLDQHAAKIENKSGVALPTTGGHGTATMYAVGALLVLGAGVAIVTKRRMASSE